MSTAALFTGATGQTLASGPARSGLTRVYTDPLYVCGWAYFTANDYMGVVAQATSNSYGFNLYRAPDGSLNFKVFDSIDGNQGSFFTLTGPTPSLNTYFFFELQYDASPKTASLTVNRGTPVTQTLVYGIRPSAIDQTVNVGHTLEGFHRLQGRVDSVGYAKALPTSTQRDSYYAAGAGKTWAELTTGEKAVFTGWWDFEEASGTRADATGNGNALTDANGDVGTAAGVGGSAAPGVTVGGLALAASGPAPTGLTFTVAVSGGTGTLTTRLYRLPTPTTAVGSSYLDDTAAGAGTLTLHGSPPDNRVWFYLAVTTDSLTPTAQTGQSPVKPASRYAGRVNVTLAGDSITADGSDRVTPVTDVGGGATASDIDLAVLAALRGPLGGSDPINLRLVNCGWSGTASGDWVPLAATYTGNTVDGSARNLFALIRKSVTGSATGTVATAGQHVVAIGLGTNDRTANLPATTAANLQAIADGSRALGPNVAVVVLDVPYSINTDLPAFWNALEPLYDTLTGVTRQRGDYAAFAARPTDFTDPASLTVDGTHPNALGQRVRGQSFAAGALKALGLGGTRASAGKRSPTPRRGR